jgi:hypothetical protein
MGGRARLQAWIKKRAALRHLATTSVIHEPEAWRLQDGVDYRLPWMVPSGVATQGNQAVHAYLLETDQTYRGQFDQGRSAAYDGPVGMPTEDPLCEWNRATRIQVLTNCHAAYHRNPLAKRAVDLTRQFAIGKGFNLTFQNKRVEEIVTGFINNPENNIKEYEKTFLQDLQIDGELLIRFFKDENGQTVISPLPPWWLTEIDTDPEFFRRVKAYHFRVDYNNPSVSVVNTPPQKEIEVAAADILHVAINRHSYELRGRPDLFVILPWLRAYKEWMEDRVRQNKWRGALLWWAKIIKATPGVIAQKVLQYRKPPAPGSMLVTSDNEEWTALNNPVGAGDVSEDGRQIKMNVAVGVGLPEYMLSDGENANLASATAQQLPALWKFVDAQEIMKEMVWTPIFKRVIANAVQAGLIDEMVNVQDGDGDPLPDEKQKKIKAVDAFTVEYHELQSDDPKNVAEALTLDLGNGLVSKQTAATKRGYDPVQEKKLMDKEKTEAQAEVGRGGNHIFPPGQGPFEGPPNGNGQPQEKPPNDNRQVPQERQTVNATSG